MENRAECKNRMCKLSESCYERQELASQNRNGGFPNKDLAQRNVTRLGSGPHFRRTQWFRITETILAAAQRFQCPELPTLKREVQESRNSKEKRHI